MSARASDLMAVLRGIVLVGLGGWGMITEILRAPDLNMRNVALYVAMILGEGVLSTLWLAGRSYGGQPSSMPPPHSPPGDSS
jgi:hypothetical protein